MKKGSNRTPQVYKEGSNILISAKDAAFLSRKKKKKKCWGVFKGVAMIFGNRIKLLNTVRHSFQVIHLLEECNY